MRYKKYKPVEALNQYVECYFVWEGNPQKIVSIESPPPALCSLVINYEDVYFISNQKYDHYQVPRCFISGQALGNYTLHIKGKIGNVGVVFKPAAVHHIFGIAMYELTDERLSFSEVCPQSSKELYSKIKQINNNQGKILLLEEYLLSRLSMNKFGEEAIMEAANRIFEDKGQTNITDLLHQIPMSRRNFERKFLDEVGISPKTYAKIRRFSYTCSLMAGDRNANLMDVLHRGGYYDQSHFIKDFKFFSRRTPRKYAKTNVELANYIDGISIVERRLQAESQPT